MKDEYKRKTTENPELLKSKKRKKKEVSLSGDVNRFSSSIDELRQFAETPSPTQQSHQEATSSYTIVPNYMNESSVRMDSSPPEEHDANILPLLEEKAVTQRKILILRRRLAEEQESLARINADLKKQEEERLAVMPISTSPRSTN